VEYKVICFGEILWDLLPEGARIGGAPLNVCYHLNRAGIKSSIVSKIGQDEFGRQLLTELNDLAVNVGYLIQSNVYPTSTVEVSLDKNGTPTYSIVENVAWDYIEYDSNVAAEITEADAFVFGSLVARNTVSYATLLRYLDSSKYNVMDINLRAPFYSKERIFSLLNYVNLLKINDEEIEILRKWLEIDYSDEEVVCQYLIDKFPKLKEIILTKGSKGAFYFSSVDRDSIGVYEVKVKDTIGAGDSFLAGFLAKRLTGGSVKEALDQAALISAFIASTSGANPIYSGQDLEHFKNSTSLKKPL